MIKVMSIAGALVLLAGTASAQCIIQEAATAALDRQVQAIEAAQTDVSSFFQGPNSCINGDLLNMIDFSVAIPDLAGLISSLGTNAIDGLLQAGMQKACDVVNEQIDGVVGDLNGTIQDWNTGLSTEVSQILSDGQIAIPN